MKSYFLLLSVALLFTPHAISCELTMGYRTTARLPNIEASPSNAGLYFDLYSQAAELVGCELKIVRLPKLRILQLLDIGEVDFYPGFTFTQERSETIFFFENGLPSANVGLTRKGIAHIQGMQDLQGKSVLLALGGPGLNVPQTVEVDFLYVPELDFERAIKMILKGRADFYQDEFGTLSYYLRKHPRKDVLTFHMDCCGGLVNLLLGFSRQSKHYQEEPNPRYNPLNPVGPYNFPVRLKRSSKAYQLYQALMSLQEMGKTSEIYRNYYGYDLRAMFTED